MNKKKSWRIIISKKLCSLFVGRLWRRLEAGLSGALKVVRVKWSWTFDFERNIWERLGGGDDDDRDRKTKTRICVKSPKIRRQSWRCFFLFFFYAPKASHEDAASGNFPKIISRATNDNASRRIDRHVTISWDSRLDRRTSRETCSTACIIDCVFFCFARENSARWAKQPTPILPLVHQFTSSH